MTVERRKFVRLTIGGNAEITAVHGQGDVPTERAVLVDCSRSGALLRVPAPKRRLLQKGKSLQPQDSITCTLRVPPSYAEIEVFAEVVRVTWAGNNEFQNVGVRFFYDAGRRSHTDKSMGQLIQALGPAAWSQSSAIMLPLRDSPATKPKAKPKTKTAKTSKRLTKVSARLETAGKGHSKRLKKASARLERPENGTSGRNGAARPRKTSSRLDRIDRTIDKALDAFVDADEGSLPPSSDSQRRKVTLKYHSTNGHAPLPQQSPSRGPAAVYFGLAGPESGLYLRGRAVLHDGRALIVPPGHFAQAVDPATLTVHLTPAGECQGLFVSKRTITGIEILELNEGKSDAKFDWFIVGQRRGG